MKTRVVKLERFFEGERIKIKGPTKREMMDMQRHHERAMQELDRQIPIASGKIRNFVFTK